MSQESAVWRTAASPRGSVQETGRAKGEPDRGGTLDARPRAHDDRDPSEIRGVAGGGIHQGQERHPHGARLRRTSAQFCGAAFWARGYFVSTVGRDEEVIREYIRHQELEDARLEQLNLWR